MRQRTAIVLVIALTLAAGHGARADTAEDTAQHRNPIEWLFSDLGKLLSTATEKLTKTTKRTAADGATKAAQIPAEEPAPASTSKTEPEPTAAQPEPAPPAETKTAKNFRNPLAWLLGDLARIFQPDLEIEQSSSTATASAEPSAETVAAGAETVPDGSVNQSNDETTSNISAAEQAATPAKNPISWLFRDLAKLFSAPARNDTPEIVDVVTVPEAAVPTQSVTPPAEVAEATADAAEDDSVTLKSGETALAVPEPVASAPVAQSTSPLDDDVAPWVPRPNGDPFDPEDSLFTAGGAPLLSIPAPVADDPVETAEAAAPAPTAPTIRQRAPQRPAARNHLALGHNHKAVTPDPVDDTLLDRVLESLFGIDDPAAAEETLANKVADRIVPEEKLDLGYTSPDAKAPDQELTRIGDGPLLDIDLVMGRDSTIGTPYDASAFKAESCVERALQGSVFCLKDLNWPAEIASSFMTDTAFVLPGEGVVRFENGTASRIYAVFKASDFADVVKFMQHRFGPPQEREIGWMHMLEAPKLPNTTFRWQAFNADRTDAIVLEVRNFDDLRRSFADMDHGMVRLYRNGSRPIFKHISTMDLMLMQRRRVARAPVDVNQPPKQP